MIRMEFDEKRPGGAARLPTALCSWIVRLLFLPLSRPFRTAKKAGIQRKGKNPKIKAQTTARISMRTSIPAMASSSVFFEMSSQSSSSTPSASCRTQ